MTDDQAERLALEIRGIADILCAIRNHDKGISQEAAQSTIFAVELHLLRIANDLEV